VSPVAGVVAVLHRGDVGSELLHWVRRLPPDVKLALPRGNQIARQRNAAVMEYGIPPWTLFVDSDSVPPPDALARIVAVREPIVSGVVLERMYPHRVSAVKSLDPPERWALADLPRSGLVPCPAFGAGFMLVRGEVFEALDFPWFRCGQITPDLLHEDMEFCLRAGKAGFQPVLDAGIRVGHTTSAVLWPGLDGRPWVEWSGPMEHREHLDDIRSAYAEVLNAGG